MSNMVRTAEKAYSTTEAADLQGVSPDTIRRAIEAAGGACLRATRVGKDNRISASVLEDRWNRLEP